MKLAGTRRIGAASLLLGLVLTYGCASPLPEQIIVKKVELHRLKDQEEIQAIHYSLATPGVFIGDLEPQSAAAIVLVPFELLREKRLSKRLNELSLEDPILRVKERFLAALDRAGVFKHVRLVQAPLVGDGLDELKAALGKGLVIDFKTTHWTIGNSVSPDYGRVYGGIFYEARSRIVHLEDSMILWQGVCVPTPIKLGSWEQLMTENGTLLEAELNKSADICTRQLLQQLLGNL